MSQWGNQIRGGPSLGQLKRDYEQYKAPLAVKDKQIAIVRFEPPSDATQSDLARYEAAAVSMRQKVKTFGYLNTPVEEYVCAQNMPENDFETLIRQFNADERITGVIIQVPVPDDLKDYIPLIEEDKDIDALANGSRFPTGATAEGIVRIAQPFIDPETTVAVVGSEGFVGTDIIKLLQQRGVDYIPLDQGDDLLRVREADIVISVTGQPEVLDERHLSPTHRLVIDSGFVPIDGEVYGDVKKSAYGIPQNLTPVPGGTGPIEMAVLMERLVQKEIDPQIQPWLFPSSPYLDRSEVEAIQLAWAESIKSTVQEAYVIQRDNFPQPQQDDSRIERVETDRYAMTFNREEDTLSLQSKAGIELLTIDLTKNEVTSASGISAVDFERWTEVQRILDSYSETAQVDNTTDFER